MGGPDNRAWPEDKKRLVRYVGWGGLPQVFDEENFAWARENRELRRLLSPEEYAAARRSTQDAHYTSQEVISGMYQGLERLGFTGGQILEPSAGIGHFIGLMPKNIREASIIQAVELDTVSSAISRYLYPKITHLNRPFQECNPPENHFDLTIGNPPFGQQKVYDVARPDLFYSIHNYFLAKSIDSLREGGLAAFVVSRYFLDAANNIDEGYAPFAPHLHYPGIVDDTDEYERAVGISCGLSFMAACDEVWAYIGNGYSRGMTQELTHAASIGKHIRYFKNI